MHRNKKMRESPRSQRARSRYAEDFGFQPPAGGTVVSSQRLDWGSIADFLDLGTTNRPSESALPRHSIISDRQGTSGNKNDAKHKCSFCPASYLHKKNLN